MIICYSPRYLQVEGSSLPSSRVLDGVCDCCDGTFPPLGLSSPLDWREGGSDELDNFHCPTFSYISNINISDFYFLNFEFMFML